jgi:hypothetical protein
MLHKRVVLILASSHLEVVDLACVWVFVSEGRAVVQPAALRRGDAVWLKESASDKSIVICAQIPHCTFVSFVGSLA